MASKLFESITTNDSYILWIGIFTFIVGLYCFIRAIIIRNHIEEWNRTNCISTASIIRNDLAVAYNLFLTLISIFPLLGMFGTVMGLLNVDFVAGNMDNVKANFFTAHTSTAWGIIFSIVFKIINALVANHIEAQIEEAKKVDKLISPKRSKKSR